MKGQPLTADQRFVLGLLSGASCSGPELVHSARERLSRGRVFSLLTYFERALLVSSKPKLTPPPVEARNRRRPALHEETLEQWRRRSHVPILMFELTAAGHCALDTGFRPIVKGV